MGLIIFINLFFLPKSTCLYKHSNYLQNVLFCKKTTYYLYNIFYTNIPLLSFAVVCMLLYLQYVIVSIAMNLPDEIALVSP